jgi:hypothetical protein
MSDTPGVSSEPATATNNGQLAVVWSDTSTGVKTPSIYAIVSPDSAGNFSELMNVSNAGRMALHPDVTIAGGKMFVIWEEVPPVGEESTIRLSSTLMKGLATGPVLKVDPTLHTVTGNQH